MFTFLLEIESQKCCKQLELFSISYNEIKTSKIRYRKKMIFRKLWGFDWIRAHECDTGFSYRVFHFEINSLNVHRVQLVIIYYSE